MFYVIVDYIKSYENLWFFFYSFHYLEKSSFYIDPFSLYNYIILGHNCVFLSDWQNKEFTLQWDGSPADFWNFSASGTTSTLQFANIL
jgi:hypothetical protein